MAGGPKLAETLIAPSNTIFSGVPIGRKKHLAAAGESWMRPSGACVCYFRNIRACREWSSYCPCNVKLPFARREGKREKDTYSSSAYILVHGTEKEKGTERERESRQAEMLSCTQRPWKTKGPTRTPRTTDQFPYLAELASAAAAKASAEEINDKIWRPPSQSPRNRKWDWWGTLVGTVE